MNVDNHGNWESDGNLNREISGLDIREEIEDMHIRQIISKHYRRVLVFILTKKLHYLTKSLKPFKYYKLGQHSSQQN